MDIRGAYPSQNTHTPRGWCDLIKIEATNTCWCSPHVYIVRYTDPQKCLINVVATEENLNLT